MTTQLWPFCIYHIAVVSPIEQMEYILAESLRADMIKQSNNHFIQAHPSKFLYQMW